MAIKNFATNKSPRPDSFRGEFNQKLKKIANTYFTQTPSENSRGRKTPKLIL